MKTKDLLILAVIIGAIWYYTSGQTMPPPRNLSTAQKRSALVKWVKLSTMDSQETKDRVTDLVTNQMTDGEISTVYTFISEYFNKGQTVPEGSELQKQIAEISAKYNVFT